MYALQRINSNFKLKLIDCSDHGVLDIFTSIAEACIVIDSASDVAIALLAS